MLRSDLLHLRPVQQGDLDELYRQFNDLAHRGPWFPARERSETRGGSSWIRAHPGTRASRTTPAAS